jgi:hypothetical protein
MFASGSSRQDAEMVFGSSPGLSLTDFFPIARASLITMGQFSLMNLGSTW